MCSWDGKLKVTKEVIHSKLIYRFNPIPIKIPAHFFFAEIEKLNLKFTGKYKGARVAKTIFIILDLGLLIVFLDMTTKIQATRETLGKSRFH